jgi:hypothetical protein
MRWHCLGVVLTLSLHLERSRLRSSCGGWIQEHRHRPRLNHGLGDHPRQKPVCRYDVLLETRKSGLSSVVQRAASPRCACVSFQRGSSRDAIAVAGGTFPDIVVLPIHELARGQACKVFDATNNSDCSKSMDCCVRDLAHFIASPSMSHRRRDPRSCSSLPVIFFAAPANDIRRRHKVWRAPTVQAVISSLNS